MPKPLRQRIAVETEGYDQARRELRRFAGQSERSLRDVESGVTRSSGRMSTAVKAAFAGVVAFISTQVVGALRRAGQQLFQIGTAAEETAAKFNTVFGPAAERVNSFLDDFIQKTSLTVREAQDFAAAFGGLFSGVGADADEAAELSEQMVRLAGDLASFNNVPIQQALEALRSGLIGETEPLRQLNITFRQVEANAEAMAQTGKDSADDLTELERVMGRIAVITDRAGVQIGDLDRTLDSTQNQFRQLRGEVRRQTEAFAKQLIPVFQELIDYGEDLIDRYDEGADALSTTLSDAVRTSAREFIDFADAVTTTMSLLREMSSIADEVGGENFLGRLFGPAAVLQRWNRNIARLIELWSLWEIGVFRVTRLFSSGEFADAIDQQIQEAQDRLRRAADIVVDMDVRQNQREAEREVAARFEELRKQIEATAALGGDAAREALKGLQKEFRATVSEGGPLMGAYSDALDLIRENLAQLRKEREAASGPSNAQAGDGGGDSSSEKALQNASEALAKIQEAQQLRQAFTEDEKQALQDVIAAQEEIAELRKIEKELGEEAVAAELAAAEARLQRSRAALEDAKEFRQVVRQAAEGFNRAASAGLAGGFGPLGLQGDQRSVLQTRATEGGDRVISAEELEGLEEVEKAAKRAKEEGDDLAKTLQNIGAAARSVTRLADVFGDLSDEARNALNGAADLVDNVGRLIELKVELGKGKGFADLFTSENIGSSIVPAIGAAAGGASLIASFVEAIRSQDRNWERINERIEELSQNIGENIRALSRNTEALFRQGVVGGDVSQAELARAQELVGRLQRGEDTLGATAVRGILAQLEETGISAFEGIRETFDQILQQRRGDVSSALNAILTGGRSSFEGVSAIIARLSEEFGAFGESLQGLIDEVRIRRDALGQSLGTIREVLVDRLGELGLGQELTATLREQLAGLDLSDDEAVREFLRSLSEQFVSGAFAGQFGELSPNEFQDFIDFLRDTLTGQEAGGGGGAERRTVQVARTITEFQANELLAYQQEQVLLLRELVRAAGGSLGRVGASTVTVGAAPGRTFSNMEEHLAEIRRLMGRIASSVPSSASVAGAGQSLRAQSTAIQNSTSTRHGDIHITINGAGDSPERIAQKIEDRVQRKRLI